MGRATSAPPTVETESGWVTLHDALTPIDVESVLRRCDELLRLPPAERHVGDKPAAGTRHLFALEERCPVVARLCDRSIVIDAVDEILGPDHRLDQASYRCPQPGFGAQRLHADDVPRLDPHADASVATAIVALVDFENGETGNGATRVVPGSHRRPDLQRHSGSLDRHDDEVVLTGRAGTAFVFDGHLLHSGTLNRSARDRPALQLTWRRA